MPATWHRLAAIEDITEESIWAGTAEGVPLAVFRIGPNVFAVEDRCPHMAYPLHHGVVKQGKLMCTWHHWEFDLVGGQRFANDRARCTVYPTREAEGAVWVEIDPDALPPAPGGFPRPTDVD